MAVKIKIKTAKKKAKTAAEKKKKTSVSAKKPLKKKTDKVIKKPSVKAKTPSKLKKTVKTKKKVAANKKVVTARKVVTKKKVVAKKPVSKKKVRIPDRDAKKDKMALIRKSLLIKRESILKEAKQEIAKYISGETRQLVDTALDEGDWAVVDISEDISLRMLSTHRKALYEIDEAIRKIKEGTYGICEECGEEISEKRLSILPAATLCIDCKENKEKFEAVEKEEMA